MLRAVPKLFLAQIVACAVCQLDSKRQSINDSRIFINSGIFISWGMPLILDKADVCQQLIGIACEAWNRWKK